MTLRLYTEPISYVVINGLQSPGLTRLESQPSVTNMFEERGGRAVSGSTKVWLGRELSKFSLEHSLYDDADLIGYVGWISALRYPAGSSKKTIRGYAIEHPVINAWEIVSVTLLDDTAPKQTERNTWVAYTLWEEWRAPAVVAQKIKASTGTPLSQVRPSFLSKEDQQRIREADSEVAGWSATVDASDAEVARKVRQLEASDQGAPVVEGVRGL